jgi:hypothetical protein
MTSAYKMEPTAIDGDIADFLDAENLAADYSTAELRSFLLNQGHSERDVIEALNRWQIFYFEQRASWERFKLNRAGMAKVEELSGSVL